MDMPSLKVKDIGFDNGEIKLVRPWGSVKDLSGELLKKMQRSIDKFVTDENFDEEGRCLFELLGSGLDPLEIEKFMPMFCSRDRQIVFIFAVSNSRFDI